MNLDEGQLKKVTAWISEGLKLSDIQKRLSSDLGVNLTYMEVRLLVDDLKLTPKDIERAKPAQLVSAAPGASDGAKQNRAPKDTNPFSDEARNSADGVSVTVDAISRPGTVASGSVTFSDGNSAEWYLDQTGRLGLLPKKQGYRPSQEDVLAFQAQLQNELAKIGL